MNRRLVPWVLSLVLVTFFCLLLLFVVQRMYRQGANHPQIQIAEDASAAFEQNQFTNETLKSSFESFVPSVSQVDVGLSLSPWIQIYDDAGNLLESSAIIQEAQSTPYISKQIFEKTKKRGEDRVTWQPKKGIRQAIVITEFSGLRSGYIVVGRSLREVEDQMRILTVIISAAWFVMVSMIVCTAAWTFGAFTKFTKQNKLRT